MKMGEREGGGGGVDHPTIVYLMDIFPFLKKSFFTLFFSFSKVAIKAIDYLQKEFFFPNDTRRVLQKG